MARIFISYRRDDAAGYALMLNKALSAHFGADLVFMDLDGIPPGADFRQVINAAVGSCSVLVALIGVHWLTLTDAQGRRRIDSPQDFVRLEIASALGRKIPVIPALVRGAVMPTADDLPDDLSELGWRQAIELSDPRWDADVDRLIAALEQLMQSPAAAVSLLPENFEPETVRVSVGPFVMGSDPAKDPQAFSNEFPQHAFILNDYYIGKYPITNREYRAFILAGGYDQADFWTAAGWQQRQALGWEAPRDWPGDLAGDDRLLPVVGVSWYEAYAYCRWLSMVTNRNYKLPNENHWEKAARGVNGGNLYPWGTRWLPDRCNTAETGLGAPTPVGVYSPKGDSPYGASDMCGNVWEWCRTQWRDSYHDPAVNNVEGDVFCTLRGGSWADDKQYARAAARKGADPVSREAWIGFRVRR